MGTSIGSVDWIIRTEILGHLLDQEDALTLHPMDQGFEAEVMKISSDKESFVLKVWNKNSKPDVRFQFHLLNRLFELGLSVSKPLGWGISPDGAEVLLTTFDGTPVLKVNSKKMTDMANLLSSLHRVHAEEFGNLQLPKYDFCGYFFSGVREEYPDLYHSLVPLVQMTRMRQDRMIHGDFHPRNIVEANERFTVIDWTNGQLGDPRYDFAWSLTLQKIYISERYAQDFRSAYLVENNTQQEELEVFEAIACLRWILLNRRGSTPNRTDTLERVKRIIQKNPFLKFEFAYKQ